MIPREPATSGGGTRVVVDPTELRSVATTYQDAAGELRSLASRVGAHGLPELPPEIVGRVSSQIADVASTLDSSWSPFADGAKELRVRALWAEISAAGGTVSGLSAAQLRDFVAFMKDGSMLDYATPAQRQIAGYLVGDLYRDHYKEPAKLLELAAIMKANGRDAEFAGSFIESFGAERFADIPRVIQAMEWGDALNQAGPMSDPMVDWKLARDLGMLQGYRYEGDAVELLSNFSMVLATATYANTLSRDAQRRLAYDKDTWAVAQLLHEGTFGAEFLRDVFHSGVIAEIGREGGNRNWNHMPLSYWPIGGHGDDPLPTDQKQIILDALERNPEAVALAFSDRVPAEFQIGVLQGEDDAIKILYDHMRPDDDWEEQFARMYGSATDYVNDPAHPDPERAGRMTLALIDRTLDGDRDIDVMTTALARDLGDHQMDALHRSAAAADVADADGGDPGWLDPRDGYRLNMNVQQMTDLFKEIGDVEDANKALLDGAARHQASLIENGVSHGDNSAWARQVGGFDAVVMAANDLANQDDFDASNQRHQLVFSFLHNASSLIEKPGIGIPVGIGLDTLDHMTEPDIRDLIERDGSGEAAIMNQMHAAIVQGFDQNGLIHDVPARLDDGHGHLRPYSSLDSYDRAYFNRWASTDGELDRLVREAFQNADQTRDSVFEIVVR